MRPSTERRLTRPQLCAGALALVLDLGVGVSASAQDGTLRIRESALNDFARAAQPLTLNRTFSFTLWVLNPFLFPPVVPIPFSCNASASVTGIAFDITPGSTTVRGDVSGAVCAIPYQSTIFTSVAISLGPAGRSLVVASGPLQMTPIVNFQGSRIAAPFSVNLAPTLRTAVSLEPTSLDIETPAGPRSLAMDARNLSLSRFDGYFEIRGDADFR